LVTQALVNERGDVRQWYTNEFREQFQEQTADQEATIYRHIGEAKEMLIMMYNKIKESLRAAVRGNIHRMKEIVDIAMNLVKGSDNYQVATEALLRGLSELQNRKSGDELYLQAEAEEIVEQPDIKELEREIERINNQVRSNNEVPVNVIMQNDGTQSDGRGEGLVGDDQNGNSSGDQEQQDQPENQNNQSDQASQSSNRSRGNRGDRTPRQTRTAFNPFSGNMIGCFLTVSGRPNIAWTRTEYERLTRNGYNLVRVYDNFEQALAWLRRKRRRYRIIIRTPQMPIGQLATKRMIQMSQVQETKGGDQTRETVVNQIGATGITMRTIKQADPTKIINSLMG
jgi:hypothetical protein